MCSSVRDEITERKGVPVIPGLFQLTENGRVKIERAGAVPSPFPQGHVTLQKSIGKKVTLYNKVIELVLPNAVINMN